MSPDIHTLTGAYAVDALPDDERRRFERHLGDCQACQQEVAELTATAARLGTAAAESPPPGLRHRVLAAADTVRQEPPATGRRTGGARPPVAPPTSPWVSWLAGAAAAILAIAAVYLAGLSASLDHRVEQLEAANQRVAEILSSPDATTLTMDGPQGAVGRVVMAPSRGQALFVADGLPPVPEDRIYELWLIAGEQATPAGLVRPDDQGQARHVMEGEMAGVTAIGVTVEPAGGSPQPTSDPVMVTPVPQGRSA